MALARFFLYNSLERVQFFEKTFLLFSINMEVVLGIPFLLLNNANVEFAELEKLTWRSYIVAEALSTTIQIELIGKNEFAKATIDKNFETFIIYLSALDIDKLSIYPFQIA